MNYRDTVYGALDAIVIVGYAAIGLTVATAGTSAEFVIFGTTFILWGFVRYWLYFNSSAPPLPWDREAWQQYNSE